MSFEPMAFYPAAVGQFSIDQVVAGAGDGNLKDGPVCAKELQEYLGQVPLEKLSSTWNNAYPAGSTRAEWSYKTWSTSLAGAWITKRSMDATNATGFTGIWIAPEGGTIA
jgi:hypothetical protein